jgi:hypothetical protein
MTDKKDLESRLAALEDIEAIKKLKARYLRCVDNRLWDEMNECFTEDAVADYGSGRRYENRKAIMNFFTNASNASKTSAIGAHHGHNPEIELVADSFARGIWQLLAYRIDTETNLGVRDVAFYNDEYIKVDGVWKIKLTTMTGIFREEFDRAMQGLHLVK